MKLINLVLKALKWLKGIFDLVKWILALVVLLTSLGWAKSCKNGNEKVDNITTILTGKVETFKTESGLNAAKAENWQIKYKAAERIIADKSQTNSQQVDEIVKATQTIADLEIRLKDAKNYISTDLEAKDSIRTEIVFINCDQVEIKPIKKKHISITFKQKDNVLDLIYVYNAELSTVISRYPEFKRNGKKHFPNWGWLYGWDYMTTSIIDDPNATINNVVSIEFDK